MSAISDLFLYGVGGGGVQVLTNGPEKTSSNTHCSKVLISEMEENNSTEEMELTQFQSVTVSLLRHRSSTFIHYLLGLF